MSMLIRPPADSLNLPARLGAIGKTRKTTLALTAVFTLASVVVSGLILACSFDVIYHLSPAVRAIALVAIVVSAVLVIVRLLLPALKEPSHPLAIAIMLEDKYPKLNDAVASAVDFETTDRLGSARFRSVAVTRAHNLLRGCDPDLLVPSGRAWRTLALAVLSMAVALPLTLMNTARADRALTRLFSPYGVHPWPPQTTVSIVEPVTLPTRIAKGEAFVVKFDVAGMVPTMATFYLRYDQETPTEDAVALTPGEQAKVTLDASRANRDFEFRIVANDADTGWKNVEVAPPPRLVPFDGRASPRITLTFPEYTKLPVTPLPDGSAVVEAVAGTQIHIVAQSDRPLSSVVLRPQADLLPVLTTAAVAGLAGINPIGAFSTQTLADSIGDDVPLTVVEPQRTRIEGTLIPKVTGLYALRITDDTGLTGTRLFDLRMYPDPAPTVTLIRPNPEKDVLTLLPTGTVMAVAGADDRSFGLKSLALEYRVGSDDHFRAIPLGQFATPVLGAVAGAYVAASNPNPTSLELAKSLPVASFTKANGTAPGDGDTITVRAMAEDWDNVTPAKAPGVSKEIEIRIASKTSIEATVEKELAALRPLVRQAVAKQKEAQDALANPLPSPRERIAAAENMQRDIDGKLNDPREGIQAKVEALKQLARENALPKAGPAGKVEDIARDLGNLAEKNLEPVNAALELARRASENQDAKAFDLAAKSAEEKQRLAEKALAGVLEKLDRWGSAGEVRGDARTLKQEIQKATQEGNKALAGEKPEDAAKASEKIARAAEDVNELLAKAGRLAAEKTPPPDSGKPTTEADALRDAIRQAGGQALAEDLRAAAEALKQGRATEATAKAEEAGKRLDAFADALAEKKPATPTPEELSKKNKDAQKEVKGLREEQDELKKKTKEAQQKPDPGERQEALKNLAEAQKQLAEKTEQLAEKLKKNGAERSAEKLARAADEMKKAQDKLEQGEQPQAEQDQALEKLNDAKKDLNQDVKENQEELEREKREEAGAKIKNLRDRQAAAVAEAKRLTDDVTKEKGWDRGKLASLSDLADVETKLAQDIRAFAEKDFTELVVFARLAEQAADAAEKAAKRILERKDEALNQDPGVAFDAVAETVAHTRVARPMALALARLDQILEAVKPDAPKKPGEKDQPANTPKPEENPEGMPPPQQQNNPAALGQLKALRALQADLVTRTESFHKANPYPEKYGDDEKEEIKELEQGQREVAELFEKLLPLFQPKEPDGIP